MVLLIVAAAAFAAGYFARDWQSKRRRSAQRRRAMQIYDRTGGSDPTAKPFNVGVTLKNSPTEPI